MAILVAAALLGACGGDDAEATATGTAQTPGEDALPAPTGADGPVTGMPDDPGDGTISLGGGATPEAEPVGGIASGAAAVAADGGAATAAGGSVAPAIAGTATTVDAPVSNPGAEAAAAVIQDYYQALNARQYERARGLWADGGGASGQSPAQFAGGFADTVAMDVRVVVPDRVDTATGVAYTDVPVRVIATAPDGSRREYGGRYTLRAEDGGWRIAATDLGPSPP